MSSSFTCSTQAELDLPFDGNILFEDLEAANLQVIADPRAIRATYKEVVQEFITDMRKQCHDERHRLPIDLHDDAAGPSAGELFELERVGVACRFFFSIRYFFSDWPRHRCRC